MRTQHFYKIQPAIVVESDCVHIQMLKIIIYLFKFKRFRRRTDPNQAINRRRTEGYVQYISSKE